MAPSPIHSYVYIRKKMNIYHRKFSWLMSGYPYMLILTHQKIYPSPYWCCAVSEKVEVRHKASCATAGLQFSYTVYLLPDKTFFHALPKCFILMLMICLRRIAQQPANGLQAYKRFCPFLFPGLWASRLFSGGNIELLFGYIYHRIQCFCAELFPFQLLP